jgi:hypothetical protein
VDAACQGVLVGGLVVAYREGKGVCYGMLCSEEVRGCREDEDGREMGLSDRI